MRTNVVIDEKLLAKVRAILGTKTKKDTIEAAMNSVVRRHQQLKLLELRGIGWEGNLSEMRSDTTGD